MSEVYFIQAGKGGPIKIGYTSDLARRLRDIAQGLPDMAVLLATLPGGRELELRLHRALHASHRRLEWFNPTPEGGKRPAANAWSRELEARFSELIANGMSAREAGKAIGKTASAGAGKFNRMQKFYGWQAV